MTRPSVHQSMWRNPIRIKQGGVEPEGDTSGPGGQARVLRHVPVHIKIMKNMEDLCPEATHSDFNDPLTVITRGFLNNPYSKGVDVAARPVNEPIGSPLQSLPRFRS